jgi:hypothetical protein
MTRLRRFAALVLALMLLKLVRVLRLLVRLQRRHPGPSWLRMSRAVLALSGIVAPWLAG